MPLLDQSLLLRRSAAIAVACLALLGSAPVDAALEDCAGDPIRSNPQNPLVEIVTALGSICVEVLVDQAPLTAANFLGYVADGAYDGALFHRQVPGFVLQGGGYESTEGIIRAIEPGPPVQNEPCTLDEDVPGEPGVQRCSERGNVAATLAMAKKGDPVCVTQPHRCVPRPDGINARFPSPTYVNSATNQWFISTADNRANLDNQTGGFTVFARVVGDGMIIVDTLMTRPRLASSELAYSVTADPRDLISALTDLPLNSIPAESPGGYGCFDVTNLAVPYSNDDPPQPFADGELTAELERPLVVSASCGDRLASPDDFVPNPNSNPQCPIADVMGWWAIDDELDMLFRLEDGQKVAYSFTCEQIIESLDQLDLRLADMGPRIEAQLLVMERVVNLPEASPRVMGLAALAVLGLLRRRLS